MRSRKVVRAFANGEEEYEMQRVILHCDMNNFYASVECMLNPELKNKPVAVCGSVEERHGIVLAKNYAAKACLSYVADGTSASVIHRY